jgi:transposase
MSGGMRTKGSAAELEQRRRQAVALLEEGLKGAQVARVLGVSGAAVTRWKQAYQTAGPAGLTATPHPGGQSRLTAKQRQRLAKLLLQGPRRHGYRTELWTLRRVAEVIAGTFGVRYHPCHVWKVLRGLGWSCQKPERRARERDEEAIARWRGEDWPRIKKGPPDRPQPGLSR